jgi:peptidyl-prolyl cis-trans isomerase SurA
LQVESFFRARTRSLVFIVGLLGLIAGCSGCNGTPGADVVASVNGKEIKSADLEKIYKDKYGEAAQEPTPEQANILRLDTLRGMIDDEILQQRAARLNIAASDEDVNARLTEMKALDTQEEFERKLKEHGQTLDDLKRDIRRGLTRTKLLNKEIESKINITDAEITSYYNAHKAEFNNIEPRYHLLQIVVTGAPPQQGAMQSRHQANEAEARKEIQSIRTRVESGEDFGMLASQFSENANYAPNGGDMGLVSESVLKSDHPDIYNAVNAIKPGQVTDTLPLYDGVGPSRKVIGYQIYKLLDRQAAGQRDLKDPRVNQAIRQELRNNKTQMLQYAYYEELHDEAKVRNYLAEQILKKGAQ